MSCFAHKAGGSVFDGRLGSEINGIQQREGILKQHIVFDAVIAQDLLTDVENGRAAAIHMILSKLADISHGETYEMLVRDVSVASLNCIERWMHQGIATAPGRYFSARKSAFIYPDAGARYATLFQESFNSARTAIRAARLAYHVNNDVDRLLETVLPEIGFVLTHAAEWLGHRDGLPSQEFPGSSLPASVKSDDLDLWLELFAQDLQRLYDAEKQFTRANILALGRHVERLLWTVQIFPWPMPDGSLYVNVPVAQDDLETLVSARSSRQAT